MAGWPFDLAHLTSEVKWRGRAGNVQLTSEVNWGGRARECAIDLRGQLPEQTTPEVVCRRGGSGHGTQNHRHSLPAVRSTGRFRHHEADVRVRSLRRHSRYPRSTAGKTGISETAEGETQELRQEVPSFQHILQRLRRGSGV